MPSVGRGRRLSILGAIGLACVVLLPLLGHKLLADWDEGIYAEVSREMLSGSWLVPHWNGQVWFEKPPLMLWITAGFFRVFGVSEFWARAGSAFSGVALVGLLHGWLLRQRGELTAWLGTVILLSTFAFLHACRVGQMDVLLALGCFVAVMGLAAVQGGVPRGWLPFWGGFAVAAMTKGSASVVLPLTLLVLAVAEHWALSRFEREFWLGLALFLALVLPWHLYLWHLYGGAFLREYLGYHVLARATHGFEGHITPPWYFLTVLLASAPPWVLVYPFALVHGLRQARLRVWALFAMVVVVFFSLVQTRLHHYILPAYPSLTVLTAIYLAEKLRALARWSEAHDRSVTWKTRALAACCAGAVFAATAIPTAGLRARVHRARGFQEGILAGEREPAELARRSRVLGREIPGPLLVLWRGDGRSVATTVFYSGRSVEQLAPVSAARLLEGRYTFHPVPLTEAVCAEPRLLVMEKALIPTLPQSFIYVTLASEGLMELGTIQRR